MTPRAVALLAAALAAACEVEPQHEVAVALGPGHLAVAHDRGGIEGRADVEWEVMEAGPLLDYVVVEPWPAPPAEPNLDYDGQRWLPAPIVASAALDAAGVLVLAREAELAPAGERDRPGPYPAALRFRGPVRSSEGEPLVAVELPELVAFPVRPPHGEATSPEPHELLWCPLGEPCLPWSEAFRGGLFLCADERAERPDPSEVRAVLHDCRAESLPHLRVVREAGAANPSGLVRTAIRTGPDESGAVLRILKPTDAPSLRWTIATRSRDEYADGSEEPIPGCGAGGTATAYSLCRGAIGPDGDPAVGCRYRREVSAGPDEQVEIDFSAEGGTGYREIFLRFGPGFCLDAEARPGRTGESSWWAPGRRECDLSDCQRDPPAVPWFLAPDTECGPDGCSIDSGRDLL